MMSAVVVTFVSVLAVRAPLPRSNCITNTLPLCLCVGVFLSGSRWCNFQSDVDACVLPDFFIWEVFISFQLVSTGVWKGGERSEGFWTNIYSATAAPEPHFLCLFPVLGLVRTLCSLPVWNINVANTRTDTQSWLRVCHLWSWRMLCFVAPLWSHSSFAFDNTDNPPTRSLIQSSTYTHTHKHFQMLGSPYTTPTTHMYTHTLGANHCHGNSNQWGLLFPYYSRDVTVSLSLHYDFFLFSSSASSSLFFFLLPFYSKVLFIHNQVKQAIFFYMG